MRKRSASKAKHILKRFGGSTSALRSIRLVAMCATGMAAASTLAAGLDDPENRIAHGHALLTDNCARCHAVEAEGDSPFAPAPPFRTLNERYDVEVLEEALAEGIVSGHPAMPEFVFAPDDVGDIIAYLKSLERQ